MRPTTIQRKVIDQEKRTVELAFSSDEPIEDFPGFFHILEHGASNVDLARLNDGAPLLLNHDRDQHVGVVERAWIGDDRKGRAVVRFGKSVLANEVFNDVTDGIRPHISVGADITGEVQRDELLSNDRKTVVRVLGWTPLEISFASIPGDTNVGVGRSKPHKRKSSGGRNMPTDENILSESQLTLARQAGAKSAGERINEIYAIGEEFGVQALAREYATNGKISDDELIKLKRAAADAYFDRKKTELDDLQKGDGSTAVSAIGLSTNETKAFSVTRALNALLENDWSAAGFERECSNQIAKLLDREARGVFIPHEVQSRSYVRREMTTGGAGTGAEHVGVQHSPENFIEQLRNAVVAIQAGARLLPGLRQTLDIPIKDGSATFAWLAESGTVTLSNLGTGNLTLTPRTVGGGVQASRRMMKQSLPAIDDLIMQDLAEGAGETIDLGILQGSGAANQPTGVLNTSGINTGIVNPINTPTWAEVVAFRTAVATDNALRGSLAWIVTAALTGAAMTIEKATGSGRFLMEESVAATGFGAGNNRLVGYPVFESNAMTAGTMLFGNWAEVLVGMWGVLDLRPDPYTAAASDALVIRAFQDVDVGVRHAVSFCKNVLV